MKSILRSVLGYSIPIWISFLVGIVSLPLMTRLLNPEDYGQYSLIISLSMFLMNLLLLGGDQAIHKYYRDYGLKFFKRFFILLFILYIPFIGFAYLVVFIFKIESSSLFTLNIILSLSLGLVFLRICEQVYRIKNDFKKFSFQIIFYALLSKIGIIFIYFYTKDFNLLLVSLALLTIVYGIISFVRLKDDEYTLDQSKVTFLSFKKIMYFSIPLMIGAQLYLLKDLIPKLILYLSGDEYTLGIFSAAFSLVSVISIFQAGFTTFYGPYFYKNYLNEKLSINLIHHIFTFIMIITAFLLIVLSEEIIGFLGPDFHQANSHFILLILSPIFISISETFVYGINVMNKTKSHIIISICSLIVSIITFPVFYIWVGGIAISLSMLFSSMTFLALRYYYSNKYLKIFTDLTPTFLSILIVIIFPLTILQFEIEGVLNKFLLMILFILPICLKYSFTFYRFLKKREGLEV